MLLLLFFFFFLILIFSFKKRTIETINRAIGDLDTMTDKQKYLEYFSTIFTMPKKIKFEPHKGDEVSAVNAQVLIRDEMQSSFIQMKSRLAGLKTENDEVCIMIEIHVHIDIKFYCSINIEKVLFLSIDRI